MSPCGDFDWRWCMGWGAILAVLLFVGLCCIKDKWEEEKWRDKK